MRAALIALCLLACVACTPEPMIVAERPKAAPIYVAPECWQACALSPLWRTAPDGTADWDDLGTDQSPIEQQKARCNAARQACANALQTLRDTGVIVIIGPGQ